MMAALATQLDNPIRVILSQTVRVIALVATVSTAMVLEWVPLAATPASQTLSAVASLALVILAWEVANCWPGSECPPAISSPACSLPVPAPPGWVSRRCRWTD
ncbi:hypothetical protein MBH78_02340 [Oceanimonas sp. NS1]|nr:hypothetical protein [Oceanimonas sp. NS1]